MMKDGTYNSFSSSIEYNVLFLLPFMIIQLWWNHTCFTFGCAFLKVLQVTNNWMFLYATLASPVFYFFWDMYHFCLKILRFQMTGIHMCISPTYLSIVLWDLGDNISNMFFSHNIRIELMEFLISDYVRSWISIEDFDASRWFR